MAKTSRVKMASDPVGVSTAESAGLRKWNTALMAAHAVQGLAILLFSTTKNPSVTVSYVVPDELVSAAQGQTVLAGVVRHIFDINLVYLVAVFFFIAAVMHGLVAFRLRNRYDADLRRSINRFRWVEYGLSGGVMLVVIGLIAGVSDLSTLLALFILPVISGACGLILEAQGRRSRGLDWLAYGIGGLAGALPWIIVLIYLISTQLFGNGVPVHVWFIFGTLLVLFKAYAVNMWLQHRQIGRWRQYVYSEKAYMILSLTAKTALAWQVFAASLRP